MLRYQVLVCSIDIFCVRVESYFVKRVKTQNAQKLKAYLFILLSPLKDSVTFIIFEKKRGFYEVGLIIADQNYVFFETLFIKRRNL